MAQAHTFSIGVEHACVPDLRGAVDGARRAGLDFL
eukprot:CAMPEP_0119295276 /NCGR_PEP_ID=MMETSP1329-20130426/49490_1 /TAXON_ID=114041 /ORGANISM="Genus nov. species nov., Strain RCC1024" /LENGTH=34 /DNA_ID= /DNA_START= /DNA_END= /DNA_ORIENTATION=